MSLALDSARTLGVALPNTASALQLMNACAAAEGGGERDHASLVQALEILSGHSLEPKAN